MKKENQAIELTSEPGHDITIIIPTFNRPGYLSRLINYYADKNLQINFLILDSSEPHLHEANRRATSRLGNRSRYLTFPSSIQFSQKLLDGLALVETKFCVFCPDDDIIFIDGLIETLSFLQKNPDYVCAHGIYLRFHKKNNDINLLIEYAYPSIDAEDPGARIFRLYQKYESLFYAVFQTQHLKQIFSGVAKNQSLAFQELFQATSALLIGKVCRLPIFYAARQACESAEPTRERWMTFFWFADNPKEVLEHYLIYRQILWDFNQNYNIKNYSENDFFHLMDITHSIYFGSGVPPESFHSIIYHFHLTLKSKISNNTFQKSDIFNDNLCNTLKNPRRLRWEKQIYKIAELIPKIIFSLYSIWDLRSLNKEILANTNNKWSCKLNKKARWLISVKSFRKTYHELCKYLCHD